LCQLKYNLKRVLKHIAIGLTIFSVSCSKTTPAGFWTDFHDDLIATHSSNQGPWGGYREINWKSEIANTFHAKELLEFSAEHDWTVVDSMAFSTDTLTARTVELKTDDYATDIFKEEILPKLKAQDSKLFVFKTTWLAVEPGNTRDTFDNGFAVLNANGTALKVYHIWGE
jgi:hypothetical protein